MEFFCWAESERDASVCLVSYGSRRCHRDVILNPTTTAQSSTESSVLHSVTRYGQMTRSEISWKFHWSAEEQVRYRCDHSHPLSFQSLRLLVI